MVLLAVAASVPVLAVIQHSASADPPAKPFPPPPAVFVSDARDFEGAPLVFEVSLSQAPGPGESVSVAYATAPGSADAADFTAASDTLTFTEGELTKQVQVPTTDDSAVEATESFTLNLSSPVGATLGDAQGTGFIEDDETSKPFRIYVSDAWVTEGNSGQAVMAFTVSVSPPLVGSQTVSVKVASANGGSNPASTPSDYAEIPLTTLTFTAASSSQTVSTTVNGDTEVEQNETFLLNLSAPSANAVIADSEGLATIVNDDGSAPTGPLPAIFITDARVLEGAAAEVTVSLSQAVGAGQTVSVTYQTVDIDATSADYFPVSPTVLTFTAGEQSKVIQVQTKDDVGAEGDEEFRIDLSNAVNATMGDSQGTVVIIDDETVDPFSITVSDAWVVEGDVGPATMNFTVAVSPPPTGQTVTVSVATSAGGANPATTTADYTPLASTQLTFDAANPTRTVATSVVGDIAYEDNETYLLILSLPSSNAVVADSAGMATIMDDDLTVPFRLMALGDSITEGKCESSEAPSYRNYLWDTLQANGFTTVDFVGTRTGLRSPTDGLLTCDPGGVWDKDQEGHAGWRADEIANGNSAQPQIGNLADWMASGQPDVVLIHLGTNDLAQGQSDQTTIDDLASVIDTLRAANPNIKVLLAQIIPFTATVDDHDITLGFNALVPGLAASKTTATSPVVAVDHHTGYLPSWNPDRVHPSETGQQFIASGWYQALVANGFLPGTTPSNQAPTDVVVAPSSVPAGSDAPTVVGLFSATDPDSGDTHSYSLVAGDGDIDNGLFTVVGAELRVAANVGSAGSRSIRVRVTDAGGLFFEKVLTITVDATGSNQAPVADDDVFVGVNGAVGNTLLAVGVSAAAPVKSVSGSVLDGDSDPDVGDVLTAGPASIVSTAGGTVSMNVDGTFTYLPPVGFVGTDTFVYTVSDGQGGTDVGTVTIEVVGRVWYVDSAAASGGDGRSSSPFTTLSPLSGAGGAGDVDSAGDVLFVFSGSGPYGGGLVLEAGQSLFGQPHGLSMGGAQLVAPGGVRPRVNGGVVISDLTGGVVLSDVELAGSAGDNVRVVVTGGSGSLTMTACAVLDNNASTGGAGLLVEARNSAVVSVTVSSCTFSGNRTRAVSVNAFNSAQLSLDVSGNTIVAGAGAAPRGDKGVFVLAQDSSIVVLAVTTNKVGTDGTVNSALSGTGIELLVGTTATLSGQVTANTVHGAGAGSGSIGIRVLQSGNSSATLSVTDNVSRNAGYSAIFVEATGASAPPAGKGLLNLALVSNNAAVLAGGGDAVHVESRNVNIVCARIQSNTTTDGGGGGSHFGLLARQSNTSQFRVEGLNAGNQSPTGTKNYLIAQNPTAINVAAAAATNFVGVTTCPV
ncbi:MAG TPA: Calx-beta domain-containing protein [Ilumatobacter sp.]|nr:Calx-beta domain-containing protein [Ilumatobacter sp.]